MENNRAVPEKKNPQFGHPFQSFISFGVQPQAAAAEETVNQPDPAPLMEDPLTVHPAQRSAQPRKLTPPPYLTAQLHESSEESDEYVEATTTEKLNKDTRTTNQ